VVRRKVAEDESVAPIAQVVADDHWEPLVVVSFLKGGRDVDCKR
jgi:hypothetical protein